MHVYMGLLCLAPLSTIVQLYRGCQLIGGGDWSIRRNPPTSRKWLTDFIPMHICIYIYIRAYVQCPIMAAVNITYPMEIMYTCLMRQYKDFLKDVQSTYCP